MATVDVGGLEMAYDLHGPADGEPVLLLGGTSMPRGVWQLMQLPALVAVGYRVATLDARGSGESAAPPGAYSIAELADDTAGVLKHLGWESVRILGLSQGGFVAEQLALTRPDLVRAAVLLGCAGATTAYQRAWFTAMRALLAAGPVPEEFYVAENLMNALPAHVLRDDDTPVAQWAELIRAKTWDTPGDRGQYLACIQWMLDVEHAARWPQLSQPILVLALEHDLMFPPRTGRAAAAAMPNGTFAEITGHAHGGAIEAGDQITPLVLDFFAAH
ncbi:alpha/beta fold hydrolase [Nonomuraea sp. LPB2021202275-12-8]|uniref:alpha/beta fold hydrolase n=1 Tax=Nonomuraea sp. LPB2021202275-12-8 TaxID=3120159 RepID=UPI00300CA7CE